MSVQQLPALIKEWMTTEEEVRALSAAVREKKKRLTTVRGMITKIMKTGQIGKLNFSAGALMTRTTKTKQALSKKFIVSTLTDFFEGNAEMAAKCAAYLEERRGIKMNEKLVLEPNQ